MYKKMILAFLGLLSLFIFSYNVKAEEIFYTNQNGVNFTEEQYDFFSNMFYDGYQEYVTVDDFNKALSSGVFEGVIEKQSIFIPSLLPPTRGNIVKENGRTLSLGKSCGATECLFSLGAVWSGIPTVASYDVIGSRITGGSYTYIGCGSVTGLGYSNTQCTPDTKTNGFGYSLQIAPVANLQVATSFYTTLGTTAFGSYQHAITNVSLATSKLYNINVAGYGYVFDFYGAAFGKYDGANGVNA